MNNLAEFLMVAAVLIPFFMFLWGDMPYSAMPGGEDE